TTDPPFPISTPRGQGKGRDDYRHVECESQGGGKRLFSECNRTRKQMPAVNGINSEGRRQKAESRKQKAESRKQKAESRRQKAAKHGCFLPSVFCLLSFGVRSGA